MTCFIGRQPLSCGAFSNQRIFISFPVSGLFFTLSPLACGPYYTTKKSGRSSSRFLSSLYQSIAVAASLIRRRTHPVQLSPNAIHPPFIKSESSSLHSFSLFFFSPYIYTDQSKQRIVEYDDKPPQNHVIMLLAGRPLMERKIYRVWKKNPFRI